MQNEDRIVELLAEQLKRQDQMLVQMQQMNKRLEKVEEQQAKTNMGIGELRLSVMKLADAIENLNGLESRMVAVETQLRELRAK